MKRMFKEACLYTGDSVLMHNDKLKYLLEQLGDRNKHIGVFQIPHHGSRNNFDIDTLNMMSYYECSPKNAFVCYGTKNRYLHPSKTLLKSLVKEIEICPVNEENFTQVILNVL